MTLLDLYISRFNFFVFLVIALMMSSCSTMYVSSNYTPTLIKSEKQVSISSSLGLGAVSSKIAVSPIENFMIVGSCSKNNNRELRTQKTLFNKDFEMAVGYYNARSKSIHLEMMGGYGFQKFENLTYNGSKIDDGTYRKFFLHGFLFFGKTNKSKIGFSLRYTSLYSDIHEHYTTNSRFVHYQDNFKHYTQIIEPGCFINFKIIEPLYVNIHGNLCISSSGESLYSYEPIVVRGGLLLLID